MHQDFADPQKAACYVGMGLLSDFPGATVEILLTSSTHGKCRRIEGQLEKVLPAIGQYCRKFPMASVEYDPKDANGVVARITYRSEKASKSDFSMRHLSHDVDRPRVSVVLKKVGERDVLIGMRNVVPHTSAYASVIMENRLEASGAA